MVSFTLWPFYLRYRLNRWRRGPQIRFGRYEEKRNLLPLPGIEPRFPGFRTSSLVAIPTLLAPGIQHAYNNTFM